MRRGTRTACGASCAASRGRRGRRLLRVRGARVGEIEGEKPPVAAGRLERAEQEGRARAVERARLDDEARAECAHAQVEELLALFARLGVADRPGGRELVSGLACGLGELVVDARREAVELLGERMRIEAERGQGPDGRVLAAGADAQGGIAPAVAGNAGQARGLAGER